MPGKRLLAVLAFVSLVAAAPANAAPPVNQEALAKAMQNCPGLQNNPHLVIEAMKNCPGLSGLKPGADCPALNAPQIDPQALARAAAKCPALNGPAGTKCPGMAALDPVKCPGLQPQANAAPGAKGPKDPQVAKADKAMQKIVRALEQNKKSAEALIDAARKAGADPNVVADLEKMSAAFRQVFMSTVSPQQIIESIFSRPTPQDGGGAIIITAPDGSRWLVAPQGSQPGGMMPPPPPPQKKPGKVGMVPPPPPGQQPGMTPPPPPPAGQQPGMTPPPPAGQAPAGELIILEEGPGPLPLWPTKDHLGKDGILDYLQKRAQIQQN